MSLLSIMDGINSEVLCCTELRLLVICDEWWCRDDLRCDVLWCGVVVRFGVVYGSAGCCRKVWCMVVRGDVERCDV